MADRTRLAKYVVIDGMDGCGKGTQIEYLQKQLPADYAVFTREPGGTPFADEIRNVVCDNPLAGKSTPLNNLLLFCAAREELMHNFVMPSLAEGKHVFADRGDSSTYAFQLCGEGRKGLLSTFLFLRGLIYTSGQERRQPDLYLILDLPPEESRRRALEDPKRKPSHFDVRDLAFYERVREGFREFAQLFPKQTKIIDATQSAYQVHREVMMVLAERQFVPQFAFMV